MKKKNRYTHVCIPINVYGLLQYILNFDEDIVANHTHFFVGSEIPVEIRASLPHVTYFRTGKVHGFRLLIRQLKKVFLSCFSHLFYPELRSAAIYAQDHQHLTSILIKKRDYVLLSDSAKVFEWQLHKGTPLWSCLQAKKHSFKGKIEKMLYGNIAVNAWGMNTQCTEVMMTCHNDNISVFDGKRLVVNSFVELWYRSSKKKREFVRRCFAVHDKDIHDFSCADVVVLTQPFSSDSVLTDAEQNELFASVLSTYASSNVIIKPHPRDRFDYSSLSHRFGCSIVRAHIPMELLALIGVNISTAVTFFSSSVFIFNDDVTINWLGTMHNPKLEKEYGVIDSRIITC